MRILISAGEASGEMYGAQLMGAMRSQGRADAPLEFFGVGGDRMRAAGCEIVVDAKDLSVVGITEIVSHLPKIWRLFQRLIAEADRRKPDLAIVIDSPAFNWRVAREMKKRGVPVVYYVCPQFWAWRQRRVQLLRKYVDKALVIFPFEEKFYRDRGVNAEFVGHPLADLARPKTSREEYAATNRLNTSKNWITLMPGSRRNEIRLNLPEMLRAAKLLGSNYEYLVPIAPTISRAFVAGLIEADAEGAHICLVPEALPALAHSRAGVIASGTATVEAAMMEVPFVMVYRVTRLTYFLGRWAVKVPHFAMVNLIVGKEAVPELVQSEFTAEKVIAELRAIIPDGERRDQMLQEFQHVKQLLSQKRGSALHPAERAAQSIWREVVEPLSGNR